MVVYIHGAISQIKADIPGQSKDKINLNVDGNTLRIAVVRCRALPCLSHKEASKLVCTALTRQRPSRYGTEQAVS